MGSKKEVYACSLCGYTADGKFKGDICPECNQTYWKCSKCGFLITASIPPDKCPQCNSMVKNVVSTVEYYLTE